MRIYYEVEGQGPPLLLMHGLTVSLREWRSPPYVQAQNNDYTIVLLDARGHGESDKPHDSQDYSHELMTGDIIAVLDELEITQAH